MKQALKYLVPALIIVATIAACGNGVGGADPPVALGQSEWVPLEQLSLPMPLPDTGKFAILVGQFADEQAADVAHDRVRSSDLPSSVIPVVDKDGMHWFWVSAGSFASLDDARAGRLVIGKDLGLSDPPAIILLPR